MEEMLLAEVPTSSLCKLLSDPSPSPIPGLWGRNSVIQAEFKKAWRGPASRSRRSEHCCHHGSLSHNFKKYTICSTGSPFLMVPGRRAGSWGKEKEDTRCSEGELKSNGLSGGQQSSNCGKGYNENSAVNKSHIGFSPLQPPSSSWTQTEGPWQMPAKQMKVINVQFPFKSFYSKKLSFYCIDFQSCHPEILITPALSRHQWDHPTCNSIWTWRWNKKPLHGLIPCVFPFKGYCQSFWGFLSDHRLISLIG